MTPPFTFMLMNYIYNMYIIWYIL